MDALGENRNLYEWALNLHSHGCLDPHEFNNIICLLLGYQNAPRPMPQKAKDKIIANLVIGTKKMEALRKAS